MTVIKEKSVRRKRKSRKGGGIKLPKTSTSGKPAMFVLPMLVVGFIAFIIFRPDPNVIKDAEDQKILESIKGWSSDPNATLAEKLTRTRPGSSGNNPGNAQQEAVQNVAAANNGNITRIELRSMRDLDRDRGPVDLTNPLKGYWRPGYGYSDQYVRLRFTDTFICEIYVIHDTNLKESDAFNLRKLGEIPYTIQTTQEIHGWQSSETSYYLPKFFVNTVMSYTNRDGSTGTATRSMSTELRLIVKDDSTPSDIDDFIEYYFRSDDFNSIMLTQILKTNDVPIPLNSTWIRPIESDWRQGVSPSKF